MKKEINSKTIDINGLISDMFLTKQDLPKLRKSSTYVSVDGCIGAGKTTFIKFMQVPEKGKSILANTFAVAGEPIVNENFNETLKKGYEEQHVIDILEAIDWHTVDLKWDIKKQKRKIEELISTVGSAIDEPTSIKMIKDGVVITTLLLLKQLHSFPPQKAPIAEVFSFHACFDVQKFVLLFFVYRMKEKLQQLKTSLIYPKYLVSDVSYKAEWVFRQTNFDMGYLTEDQMNILNIYSGLGQESLDKMGVGKPAVCFLIDTKPTQIVENILKRNRKEFDESGIAPGYLQRIDMYIKKIHLSKKTSRNKANTCVVKGGFSLGDIQKLKKNLFFF